MIQLRKAKPTLDTVRNTVPVLPYGVINNLVNRKVIEPLRTYIHHWLLAVPRDSIDSLANPSDCSRTSIILFLFTEVLIFLQ